MAARKQNAPTIAVVHTNQKLHCGLFVYQPLLSTNRALERSVQGLKIYAGGDYLARLDGLAGARCCHGQSLVCQRRGREADSRAAQGRGVDVGHGGRLLIRMGSLNVCVRRVGDARLGKAVMGRINRLRHVMRSRRPSHLDGRGMLRLPSLMVNASTRQVGEMD